MRTLSLSLQTDRGLNLSLSLRTYAAQKAIFQEALSSFFVSSFYTTCRVDINATCPLPLSSHRRFRAIDYNTCARALSAVYLSKSTVAARIECDGGGGRLKSHKSALGEDKACAYRYRGELIHARRGRSSCNEALIRGCAGECVWKVCIYR